jgi:hypothetical protein
MQNNFDIIVVGGGPAGVVAAIQAARGGASTLLIEKTSRLGGTTVNAGIHRPGLFDAWGKQIIDGIGYEICKRSLDITNGPYTDFSKTPKRHHENQLHLDMAVYAAVCDSAVLEAGTKLLLHAMVGGVLRERGEWILTVCAKEGLAEFRARVLIDCTGDANIIGLAGGELRFPDAQQPATLSCSMSGYDVSQLNFPALDAAFVAAIESGELKASDACWKIDQPSVGGWLRSGGKNANHIPADSTARTSAGRTRLEVEGRQSILRLFRFLRHQPGLENIKIDYVHPEIGVRETVTIVGEKTVTVEDYAGGKIWEDAVCFSFYPIDLHGLDSKQWNYHSLPEGAVATIPRGALVPRGSRNLLAAGRCFSSDRLANSAGRVQASAMAMGQAAGALGVLACRHDIDVSEVEMPELREFLREYNAIVPDPPT